MSEQRVRGRREVIAISRAKFENIDSETAWRDYLAQATEQEANDAIDELAWLFPSFARYGKVMNERLRKFFDDGCAIYAKRFGRDWLPF